MSQELFGDDVSEAYDKLRAKRLGLPDGMKAYDTRPSKERRHKKGKLLACDKDKKRRK